MSSSKSTLKTYSNIPNDQFPTSSTASRTEPTVPINLNSLLAHAATSPIPQPQQQAAKEEKVNNSTPLEED